MYRAGGVVGVSSEVKGLKGGAINTTRSIRMARMELFNELWNVFFHCLGRLPCWVVIASPLHLILEFSSYHL